MNSLDLRMSAQRALLSNVFSQVRLVKVSAHGNEIHFEAIVDPEAPDEAVDALSAAASEIVADFPDARIQERIIRSARALPSEDVVHSGWVYARAEK